MTATTPGISFRRRAVRVASGIASAGVVAGFGLVGATPAMAATDADCNSGNTVSNGSEADIQALLDANASLICLSGTFNITAGLHYTYPELTLHGLDDAVLDGGGAAQILTDYYNVTTLTVENLTFANANTGNDGGAINAYDVTVRNSTFTNNNGSFGGAIHAYYADIAGSTFTGNTALDGGAVLTELEGVVATSTFTDNSASSNGGAIFSYGTLDVETSTFSVNEAFYAGGVGAADDLTVTNSTFDSNTASYGGGVGMNLGTVLHVTFRNNTASVEGGGASLYKGGPDLTNVRGNLFAGDLESKHIAGFEGVVTDLGGNLFTTHDTTETDLDDVQPSTQFGFSSAAFFGSNVLADNGGPTQTVALPPTSLAIDAVPVGSPSVTVDQRGVARDALSDAGAFEEPVPAVVSPALANTGAAPAGWLGGVAAVLLAAGALAVGVTRRARLR